jgi:hypothetical protein
MRLSEFSPLNEDLSFRLVVPSKPEDVANIQRALSSFEYDVDPTGTIDDRTVAAIKRAQHDVGLPSTGRADQATIDAINDAMVEVPGMIAYMAGASTAQLPAAPASIKTTSSGPSAAPAAVSTSPVKSKRSAGPKVKGYALEHDKDFMDKVKEVANKLGVRPNALLAIMKKESGLDPSVRNKIAVKMGKPAAVGLIQFMPATARQLGTTTEELANMSAVDQMDYVYKYYKINHAKPGMDAGDLYMLTFLPAYAGKDPKIVLGQKGGGELGTTNISKNSIYKMNPSFDNSGKGYFTIADVKQSINAFA